MFKLRELERRDLETINKWRNNPELIQYLGAPFRYINLEVDVKWFEHYMVNRGSSIRCAIIQEDAESEILGLVSLTDIDFINRCARLHIMIGEGRSQGKGLGTFAIKEMLEHAFYNMNLRRIELRVLATNERAIHLYSKVGFQKEGLLRRAVYKSGAYQDEIIMGLLREEYDLQGG